VPRELGDDRGDRGLRGPGLGARGHREEQPAGGGPRADAQQGTGIAVEV